MTPRFELRPQKWCEPYPYDEGWAVYDTAEQRQCGWFANKRQAEERVAKRNSEEVKCPAAS
jgi:hypothetical protein